MSATAPPSECGAASTTEPSARPPTLKQARAFCRRLARHHYENFTVASWLLPRRLRPHFYHVYAYCRWADDLADETADPDRGLSLLDAWEQQLRDCYRGAASHPVFVALGETIRTFDIPKQPFLDLLTAFRRDQQPRGYETFDELLEYCRHSANPVGRIVLSLGRCHDERRAQLSDSICTGLQLANFWQDVGRDRRGGRVYLPAESRRRFGYDDAMLAAGVTNDAFRRMMGAEVDRAERFLRAGQPLVQLVSRELRVDVALFIEGGLAVLDAIRRMDYDLWYTRPVVSKWTGLRLLARCWWTARRGGGA